jgi:hypothetical protein
MKKKLFITLCLIIALITMIFIQMKPSTVSSTENPTNESISLAVYKSSNYTSDAYKNALAQLHVVLESTNTTKKNEVVWEKTFDSKYLSQYPTVEDVIKQNIEIKNVLSKNEQLIVKYDIIYSAQGSVLQIQNEATIDDTSTNVTISI